MVTRLYIGTISERKQEVHAILTEKKKKAWNDDDDQELQEQPLLDLIPSMVHDVKSNIPIQQMEGSKKIGKILAQENAAIDDTMLSEVIPKFVELLSNYDSPLLQLQVSLILADIVWERPQQTNLVIEHGAIPILVEIIGSPTAHIDLKENAALTLANILDDSLSTRDLALDHSAALPLLTLLPVPNRRELFMIVSLALANLCREPIPSNVLQLLVEHMMMCDEQIVTRACWTLSYISHDSNEIVQHMTEDLNERLLGRLTALLMNQSSKALKPAVRTLGNLLIRSTDQIAIKEHVLSCFKILLTYNQDQNILKEVCRTISNIAAGGRDEIQAVIDVDLIGHLVRLTKEENLRVDILYAISNAAARGSRSQIRSLVDKGCIEALSSSLLEYNENTELVVNILEGLQNILTAGDREAGDRETENEYVRLVNCDGKKRVELLKLHDDYENIGKKAALIEQRYWKQNYKEGFSRMSFLAGKYSKELRL